MAFVPILFLGSSALAETISQLNSGAVSSLCCQSGYFLPSIQLTTSISTGTY